MLAIFSSRYQLGPFLFFLVAEVMSDYLTTDGLGKFSLLPEAPLRAEARGICHICHMVSPALVKSVKIWQSNGREMVSPLVCATVCTAWLWRALGRRHEGRHVRRLPATLS